MSRERDAIKFWIEIAETKSPVDSDEAADFVANELQMDAVDRWADEVRAAISSVSRLDEPESAVNQELESRRSSIEAQIARLQRELAELGGSKQSA